MVTGFVAVLVLSLAVALREQLPPARRPPEPPARTTSSIRRGFGALMRRPGPPTDGDVARWCDDIARRLRAGDALSVAVRDAVAAPGLRMVIAPVLLALERGVPLAAALQRMSVVPASVTMAFGVLTACAAVGGPAAEPVDRVAATLRLREADTAERRAHSAQARMSAAVLTILPAIALVVMAAITPSIRDAVMSPPGGASLVAGSLLSGVGWLWMRRIIAASS